MSNVSKNIVARWRDSKLAFAAKSREIQRVFFEASEAIKQECGQDVRQIVLNLAGEELHVQRDYTHTQANTYQFALTADGYSAEIRTHVDYPISRWEEIVAAIEAIDLNSIRHLCEAQLI